MVLSLGAYSNDIAETSNNVTVTTENNTTGVTTFQKKYNSCGKTENETVPFKYFMDGGVVRHAGGVIGGYTVTNSLEAFQNSYASGYRFFEVDITETSDDVLVCSHGWNESDYLKYFPLENVSVPYQPTVEEFLNYRICNNYTPMTFSKFIDWMEQNQDAYVLLDIKLCDYETANKIAKEILRNTGDKKILSRMLVSARTTDMMRGYCDVYPFPWRHMLYADDSIREESIGTPEAFLQFCKEYGVTSYSIPTSIYTKELAEKLAATGLKSYVYMVQNSYDAAKYVSMGADFVISDYLQEDCLEHFQKNGSIGLVATKKEDGITLDWNLPQNVTSCCVVRIDAKSGEEKIIEVSNTQTSFVDTTIQSDIIYTYFIRALSDNSDKILTSPKETYIWCNRPQITNLENAENGVKITWTPVENVLKYRIARKIGDASYTIIKMSDKSVCEYIDISLPKNIEEPVYYRVNAELTDGHAVCYSGYGKPVKLNIPSGAE